VLPPHGVYAVEAILDGDVLPGVANLGVRPTFASTGSPTGASGGLTGGAVLEVHLLDFDGDLYGRELEVCFLQLLRKEQKFSGVAALKAQIARDIAAARERLRA